MLHLTKMKKSDKAKIIIKILDKFYPETPIPLNHNSVYTLLIAVLLSAQCTDERVNRVTSRLFSKYPTAEDFAKLPLEIIKKEIYSTGFYNNKAKNIKKMSKVINSKIDQENDKIR